MIVIDADSLAGIDVMEESGIQLQGAIGVWPAKAVAAHEKCKYNEWHSKWRQIVGLASNRTIAGRLGYCE